ncbi:MAG: MBL fold metallo-hydrolase [Chloroflexi bacterium]|nr:MBL fold metallo-hydrolase [Chloroflexota bacterium]
MTTHTLTIGGVTVTALSDGVLSFPRANFFPAIPAEQWAPYQDNLTADDRVSFNLGSFLLRMAGHTILVDTGMGPLPASDPEAGYGKLIADLKAKGIRPGEIDLVVMTHLHRDHVGWNLSAPAKRPTLTFPKARYWVSAADWEFFSKEENLARFPTTRTCVLPLQGLGRLYLMDGEHALTPEVTALPTPGHTPGHMSILIASQGEKAVILGDVAHLPLQVQETGWRSRADVEPDVAEATRRALMDRIESEGMAVVAGHFPAPGFGRLVRVNGKRVFRGV